MSFLALIDGSSLAHRSVHAASGAEKDYERALLNAPDILERLVRSVLDDIRPRYVLCAGEGEGRSDRATLDETYKAHRAPRPQAFYDALDACFARYEQILGHPVICVDGAEADDVLATLAAKVQKPNWTAVIISSDKDMAACVRPGAELLLIRSARERIRHTSETVGGIFGVPAERIAMFKAIAGDKADGITGVDGLGPVAACKLAVEYDHPNALLAALDDGTITGNHAKKLADGRGSLTRSFELATLDCGLDVPVDWGKARWPHAPVFARA